LVPFYHFRPDDPSALRTKVLEAYGKVPLSFEKNVGQSHPKVGYFSRGVGRSLFLASDEAVLILDKPSPKANAAPARKAAVLRMKVEGANPKAKMTADGLAPGVTNYYIGKDPTQWREKVPSYMKVRVRETLPGVDLVYYGNNRRLEYDFEVKPGTDPAAIKVEFEGADKANVNGKGDLVLTLPDGEVVFEAPVAYQERSWPAKGREPVESRYVLAGGNKVGFQVGNYDLEKTLVIDPVLVYSTYFGGGQSDIGLAVAVDSAGRAVIVGQTATNAGFPHKNPP
jgi:hypothetical protein